MAFKNHNFYPAQLRGASVTKTLTARSLMASIPLMRTPLRAEKALQSRNKGF
jgi:hypothetical protein